jgi:hypothetical protein
VGRRQHIDARGCHDFSLDRPENAPSFDVFRHNPKRPSTLMQTLVVISILALLTISGAVYTDQLMTSAQQVAEGAD